MSFVILFHIFSLLVITIIFHGLTHIFRGQTGTGNTLKSCGITEESIVHFSLSTFAEEELARSAFFIDDVVPSVQQTTTGISVLLSSLYVIVSIVSSCDCFSGLGLLLIKLTICYFLYNHDTYVKKCIESLRSKQQAYQYESYMTTMRCLYPDNNANNNYK